MTALYPSRDNPELNARALAALEIDKKNEASSFMDGAWTGHPDQNEIAVKQFPEPNQLQARPTNHDTHPDLRPVPTGVGTKTIAGTRAAVRTVIRYRNGVLDGHGASLLDGYMEDLATDRIYRLMIAQRIRHRDVVEILDENSNPIAHTPEMVTKIFDEELRRILGELRADATPETVERFTRARVFSERMIVENQFNPS
jgi:malate synthase